MREVLVSTDVDGRAVARFPCYSGEFDSSARAPGYYDEVSGGNEFKCSPDSMFYANLLEHEKSPSSSAPLSILYRVSATALVIG